MAEAFCLEPLIWGHGARHLEVFLEPMCPLTADVLQKIKPLLLQVGEENLTIQIHLYSQSWYVLSGLIVRAVLAASALADGREAAWRVLWAVTTHREEFSLLHDDVLNMRVSLEDILIRLEEYTGLPLIDVFSRDDVFRSVRKHIQYSCVHCRGDSPIFVLDGAVDSRFSWDEALSEWASWCLEGVPDRGIEDSLYQE